jgi:hypothetical protein
MCSLADVQSRIAASLRGADAGMLGADIVGGSDPGARFEIHARHFQVSLAAALEAKFPGLLWLVGARLFASTARAYAKASPPRGPCIAEYGSLFPAFLAAQPQLAAFGFIEECGRLEWAVGQAAIAVARPVIGRDALAGLSPEALFGARLELQPGISYLAAEWPVDVLLRHFLDGDAPGRMELVSEPIDLEVSGAHGTFSISRIDRPARLFRAAVQRGETVGAALEAIETPADAAAAFANLFDDGLVVGVITEDTGVRDAE